MAEEAVNPIYEPRKFYENGLKQQCHEAAEKYFDDLAASAKTDVATNATHVKQLKALQAELESKKKKNGNNRGVRIFLIVLIVLSFIGGAICCYLATQIAWWLLAIGIPLIAGGIALIVYVAKGLSKAIKKLEDEISKLEEERKKKLDECYADMAGLNASYDWNIPCKILKQATPILNLDPYFSIGRFNYLSQKFGMPESLGDTTSVIGVVSGSIQGNPFVLEKDLSEEIINKTYTGSLTISWTTVVHTKDGTRTVHHTETLHASVKHEAPSYEYTTRLIYGNEAAPHLHFTRVPSGQSSDSDKELAKFVKKRNKELTKKAEKALTDSNPNTNFSKMGNEKFDALFGADDRDNEVEFRLLYTPLAQKNVLDILTNPNPFGDDFFQVKDGMLNSICSRHSQLFDYNASPVRFVNYDFEVAKKNFVSYCDDFIKNLYFDLAPLISIPLYQTYKPEEEIYGNNAYNLSNFEHEVMANALPSDDFMPKEADPTLPLILKVANASKSGSGDTCEISVLSFKTTPQTDYVRVHGGDGRWHNVPVHWTLYEPVTNSVSIGVTEVGGSQQSYASLLKEKINSLVGSNGHYERGLFAYMLKKGNASTNNDSLKELFTSDTAKK